MTVPNFNLMFMFLIYILYTEDSAIIMKDTKKNLYISDLDGTLLNKDAEVSQFTKDIINKFTQSGRYFTVATARTLDTVLQILDGTFVNTPIILLNGVAVYDMAKKMYEKIEIIEKNLAAKMFDEFKMRGISGFVYAIEGSDITYYYENLDNPQRKAFHDERVAKYGRVYTKVSSFAELLGRDIVYFSTCDTFEQLAPINESFKDWKKLNIEFYKDIYDEKLWYLEVCSVKASKYNAVKYLRETCGFDYVVCFGDNLNDLSMFEASDERYAMANAKDEVKSCASGIIGSNINDGVANHLAELMK